MSSILISYIIFTFIVSGTVASIFFDTGSPKCPKEYRWPQATPNEQWEKCELRGNTWYLK